MYEDKLDGRITNDEFDRKAAGWRTEQQKMLRAIEQHQKANQSYMGLGMQLLDLAQEVPRLFRKQTPGEQRKLLGLLLSNCLWKDGKLTTEFRKPFDLISESALLSRQPYMETAAGRVSGGRSENWLPDMDSNHEHPG